MLKHLTKTILHSVFTVNQASLFTLYRQLSEFCNVEDSCVFEDFQVIRKDHTMEILLKDPTWKHVLVGISRSRYTAALAERLAKLNFLFAVRDPLQRAFSAFQDKIVTMKFKKQARDIAL